MHRLLLINSELSVRSPPPGPANANGTATAHHDAYVNEANFDTNMVIILASLVCALICALGLNSIVRCALRCSHRFGLETQEQAAARMATTGLKKKDLNRIPVAVYGEEGARVNVRGTATECPICLGEFVDGEKVRVLPNCNHGFHVSCIDTWLTSHSSCPNCRHSLIIERSATAGIHSGASTGGDPAPRSGSGDEESDGVVEEAAGRS